MKPDFGLAYYNLGLAYKDSKQPDQAISALRSAITHAPDFWDAHFLLGELYFNAGKKDAAKKSFEEVVRLAPQSQKAQIAKHYLELLEKKDQ